MFKRLIMGLSLSLFFCLGLSQTVHAGTTGKIAGKITDAETDEPLPGTNLQIQGTMMGAASDIEGDYFIINVPSGTYTLVASRMGYETMKKTEVRVSVDRTITVNFSIKSTVIEGQEVTIVAEREIIPMDVSASQIVADADQIVEVPLVIDIGQYISLQAGVEGNMIRGGGLDQTGFMVDGLMAVDNRNNRPLMMVNLSSVKELNIIKGGFNAEYGNIRSGLINVVTKEGSPRDYHGSIDFRISPAHLKHDGASIFSPDNYFLRPYLDPGVMWVGTENGDWDEDKQEQNLSFQGWNAYSEGLLADQDPSNDMTPEQARDLFLWEHRAEGSSALGQKEGKYGDKPDWNVDASFGGPVPLLSQHLGYLSFFASHRTNWDTFGLPTSRDYFKEENTHLKVTSRISPSMKITLDGLYGEIHSVSRRRRDIRDNDYFTSGDEILWTGHAVEQASQVLGYSPDYLNPFDVYRAMQGISFDHILSPSTFYTVKLSVTQVKNSCLGPAAMRDTTTIRYFGNQRVDERPYGFRWQEGTVSAVDGQLMIGQYAAARDYGKSSTLNLMADMTSQINKYNQIKAGIIFNYDDLDTHYESVIQASVVQSYQVMSRYFPYRFGAYVQDKLEFEGMIANFGLRLDYNDPNAEWFDVDRYSIYFKKQYKDVFTQIVPKQPAKGHIKISPRLGIAHPISANAKLYFNYGHFYSMPQSSAMYDIDFGADRDPGIRFIGNPSANLPKTIAYELGVEYNIADMFLIHLAGYYKDVSDQTGRVGYQNYDGSVQYDTIENNNYQDIRGFELSIDKRFGRWITGWINYNYMVTTSGYMGRLRYYQDQRLQQQYGLQNPYQEIPLARPYLRSNVLIMSPEDWGPSLGGVRPFGNILMSVLFNWKAGAYMTWDPLFTYKLRQNLQWKARYTFDARFSKRMRLGKYRFSLFVDIKNLFNNKYISDLGFSSSEDRRLYFESLHLPMYEGKEYKEQGFEPGDDKPGDIKSDDKPYINMPDREFLTFIGLRTIFCGIKIDF